MKHAVSIFALALLLGAGAGFALCRNRPSATALSLIAAALPSKTVGSPTTEPDPNSIIVAESTTPLEARHRLLAWRDAGCLIKGKRDRRALIEEWAKSDPQAVLTFLQTAPRYPERIRSFAIPLTAICRDNPGKVAEWLQSNLTEGERTSVTSYIVHLVGEANPREALALIRSDTLTISAREVTILLYRVLKVSPSDAQTAFDEFPAKLRKATATELASAMARADLDFALKWCSTLRDQAGEAEAKQGVLNYLAETNPTKALALIPELAPTEQIAARTASIAARTNPLLAMQMIPKLPPDQRQRVFTEVAVHLFSSAPDQTIKLAGTYLPSEDAQEYIYRRLAAWRRSDPEAASAWIAASHDPEVESLLNYTRLSDLPPAERLSRIAASPSTNLTQSLLRGTLADLSPAETSQWIAAHPNMIAPGFAAYLAWKGAIQKESRDEVAAWAQKLPAGPLQDQAWAQIALRSGSDKNFAQADAIIATIGDARLQTGTRFEIFTNLYRNNTAAAVKWLATQPVSPAIQANWQILVSATPANYFPVGFDPQ